MTAVAGMKQKAISYIKIGEIEREGSDLVFYLDNREIDRINLPGVRLPRGSIYFNRSGITAGGEIIVPFSRNYRIIVEEMSGKVRLE